jgi:bifunctional UDP-N-acetylglucosamine pyrophosphorylase / glucosamine-1-phosphate N-acetyltransferase
MELKPRSYEKIVQVINKGVAMPNPLTVDIGDEVAVDRISGNRVTIYPGCRIYGAKSVISPGVQLGKEGPVTVDDCQLGPGVELKGGYMSGSVFLEKANMSFGAHVREGCILEEEANGAHCVGLKQTILFPFVTLGSLINFCDCFMAGGTSRKDHSEVGSSYIHFNFTPDGNKSTASLFGDVPRGVMLNQRAIFLGGQGGAVGPLRFGYGTVVAAGSVLRNDVPEDHKLVLAKAHPGKVMDFTPHSYRNLSRIIGNNIIYLANLVALEQWYVHVRQPFFRKQEFGAFVYAGAIEKLGLAKKERIGRLKALVDNVPGHHPARLELLKNIDPVCGLFGTDLADSATSASRDRFLAAFRENAQGDPQGYLKAIQALPPAVSRQGTGWLQQIVEDLCSRTASMLGSLNLFKAKK